MPAHPLANFEIKNYYENESGFNGIYSSDNLLKTIKNEAYVINLDPFGVEPVPKYIQKFIRHKNIKTNIFRIQAEN